MKYIELKIPVDGEMQSEILTAYLSEMPFESFVYEDGCLKAYIPARALPECRERVERLVSGRGRYREIEDCDWNAEWEKSFRSVDIGGICRVRVPSAPPPPEGWTDIIINPRMAFGTGAHPTTRMMLRCVLDEKPAGRDVLDFGCGSGVLAVAAALAGARSVDAVDMDPRSCTNCSENAAANGVFVRVTEGSIETVNAGTYDLVLANISRNVLVAFMPRLASSLRPGGRIISSGFLECDAGCVEKAAAAAGLTHFETVTEDGWAACGFLKGPGGRVLGRFRTGN